MAERITVVGGGLGGLVAAIACAEAGARVTLHEAHATLGGRGRATAAPYVAHEGSHVFYADGPHWAWLVERGLVGRLGRPPLLRAARTFSFRSGGRLRHVPGFARMILDGRRPAPVDRDFFGWASGRYGAAAARAAANAISVVTYDADTGRLSAAFVWGLLHRVFGMRPPAVRWMVGGWQGLVDRLATRARELGVAIELDSRVTSLPAGPTVVATELASARQLLGDDSLRWESGHCVMLDVAVRDDRRDRFIVFDEDEAGFLESYSLQDPTIAPPGEHLYQVDMPVRADETTAQARGRLEGLTSLALPGWRDRVTWSRTGAARGRTGALDLPGTTWRDRPSVDRGDGVFLVGDMVAAPGMRGEISMNSALRAAAGVLDAVGMVARTRP